MIFGLFTLFVALVISAVAAYYSIVGLTAIFSAAVIPIMIMGASLEIGKLVAAVWLKLNWHRANLTYKLYLVPAVAFLMLLTSMGIFGFLSKAHSDQSLVSGDSMAKVAIYDEKIKTAKDNIDANRKALKQMDEAVDQVMGRSNDEKGADKAVAIRRGQQKERTRLLSEIEAEQKKVAQLSEERAPLAAEFRKVESEVGPIKYIAALVYGDNPDANVLERAVRLVIIIIVAVFDPLALVLILAAQQSIKWHKEEKENTPVEVNKHTQLDVDNNTSGESFPLPPESNSPQDDETINDIIDVESNDGNETVADKSVNPHPVGWMYNGLTGAFEETVQPEKTLAESHPYLFKPFSHFTDTTPIVHKPEVVEKPEIYAGNPDDFREPWSDEAKANLVDAMQNFFKQNKENEVTEVKAEIIADEETPETYPVEQDYSYIEEDNKRLEEEITKQQEPKILAMGVDVIDRPGDYVTPPEVTRVPEAAKRYKAPPVDVPETLNVRRASGLQADNVEGKEIHSGFGTKFPDTADKGDMFLRVDYMPNKLFKYNGFKWIEVDKTRTDSYTYDEQYILFLIDKLQSGEYEIDQLSEGEQELVAEKLQQIANDNT